MLAGDTVASVLQPLSNMLTQTSGTASLADQIWLWVERLGAIVAAVGVPYLVLNQRRRLPHFRFLFASGNREQYVDGTLTFGRITFQGSIQNRSLEPNTIERVYLVVWRTSRKRNTLRYGYGGIEVRDQAGNLIGPPIAFIPRESKMVTIRCDFPLTGTADQRLFTATTPLVNNPLFAMPTYAYELAMEDVSGNLFDQAGLPRSRKLIDLLWTFDNAWQSFRDGHPAMLMRHTAAIGWEEIRFFVKRRARAIGF